MYLMKDYCLRDCLIYPNGSLAKNVQIFVRKNCIDNSFMLSFSECTQFCVKNMFKYETLHDI